MTIFIHILPVFDVEIMNNSSLMRKKNKTEKANIDTNKWQVDNEFDCGVFSPHLRDLSMKNMWKKTAIPAFFWLFSSLRDVIGQDRKTSWGWDEKRGVPFLFERKKAPHYLTSCLSQWKNMNFCITEFMNLCITVTGDWNSSLFLISLTSTSSIINNLW